MLYRDLHFLCPFLQESLRYPKWGFTPEQARAAIKDASDMADLERNAL